MSPCFAPARAACIFAASAVFAALICAGSDVSFCCGGTLGELLVQVGVLLDARLELGHHGGVRIHARDRCSSSSRLPSVRPRRVWPAAAWRMRSDRASARRRECRNDE